MVVSFGKLRHTAFLTNTRLHDHPDQDFGASSSLSILQCILFTCHVLLPVSHRPRALKWRLRTRVLAEEHVLFQRSRLG